LSPNPPDFIAHLRESVYHPRSNKHSDCLSLAVVKDLAARCAVMKSRADAGALVFDLNFGLKAATADWNVDLVLGAPGFDEAGADVGMGIPRARPSTVQIAVELKSVMTEHRKAVKNRKRDLEAHHEHVHNHSRAAIAGGVLIVNASERFRSPLRTEQSVHRNPQALVRHCIDELRAVASRGGPSGYGLEAKCAVVVSTDNVDLAWADYVVKSPAPGVGDPLHHDSFIQRICDFYGERFADR